MRLCVECQHFYISFGEADWSEVTPGAAPEVNCSKRHFHLDGHDTCEAEFHDTIRAHPECADFESREQ